jgi:hypothetical protein
MLARTKQELSNLIMEKEDMSQIVSLIVWQVHDQRKKDEKYPIERPRDFKRKYRENDVSR